MPDIFDFGKGSSFYDDVTHQYHERWQKEEREDTLERS